MDDVLEAWLNDRLRVVRARTAQHYRLYVRHVSDLIGNIRADRLAKDDVTAMLDAMQLGPQSRAHALKVLRAALKQAVAEDHLARNVAALVPSPRIPRPDFRVLSVAEVSRFLEANRDTELYPLWVLAATTGMRRAELLGLEWKDVDLKRGVLHVRQSLLPLGGRKFAWEEPKTKRSVRTLTLPRIAVEALERHPRGLGSVFARGDGGPWNPRSMLREYGKALERAGLPHVTFHSLRHGVAQMLLDESGGDLRMVMSVLGHASIQTTVMRYGGMADEARRKAGDLMDGLLPPMKIVS